MNLCNYSDKDKDLSLSYYMYLMEKKEEIKKNNPINNIIGAKSCVTRIPSPLKLKNGTPPTLPS